MKLNIINYIKNSIFFGLLSPHYTSYDIKNIIPKKYCSFRKIRDYLIYNNYRDDIYSTNYCSNIIYKTIDKNNKNYKNYKSNKNYKNYKKMINKNKLTAEHIYPQSLTKQYKLAKNDAHNIYLTIQSRNSYRNNFKFVDEIDFTYISEKSRYFNNTLLYNCNYNYRNSKLGYYIPIHKSRGKIARTLAYMKIVYPNLKLNQVIELTTLIEWNSKYPPDKHEKYKNKLCYTIQGNSNIFIEDYNLLNKYRHLL